MKEAKRFVNFLLVIVLCLSMRMNVFANETKCSEDNTNISTVEVENTQVIMPRYTANIDFSEIPVSHATHGNNKFNMKSGQTITCNFSSTGKFSLALYNYDTQKYLIDNAIYSGSRSILLTVHVAGNFGIGVYNRDTKAIKVTGSYSL